MLNKRSIVGLLVTVNLILLTALLMVSYPPKLAFAQASRGAQGQFVTVTAKAAGQSYDVLYLLDTTGRKLYGVYPSRRGKLQTSQSRDLAADFNRS